MGSVFAQRLPFRTYSSDHGLPQSVVFSLEQDSDGYLWVGTPDGVSRFDGLELTTFGKDEGLGDSVVRSLHESADGTLWVGTDRGLSRRVPGTDRFEALGPETGLVATSVRAIEEDPAGILWLGTYSGLYRLEPRNGTFETRRWTTADGLPDDKVRAVLLDRQGRVWAGTYGGGMARWDGEELATWGASDETDGLDPVVRSVLELPDGTVIAGTNRGVFLFRGDAVERFSGARELSDVGVTSMLLDGRGRLWLGTRDHGACRLPSFNAPPESLECFRLRDGLADDAVNCLLEDREENLWIGTFGGGLSRLSTEAFHSYTLAEGLPHPNVRAVGESSDGRLWVGTHGGGVAVLDDGRFRPPAAEDGPLRDAKVVSSMVDDESRLWFGTLSGALREDESTFAAFRAAGFPEDSVILASHRDPSGNLWFGTLTGLWSARASEDGYEVRHFGEESGLPDPRINQIASDPAGGLWLATAKGVARFQDGRVSRVWGEADGLGDAYVDAIHRRPDGSVWAATAGGLARIDLVSGESVRTFTTKDGLSHDKCTALVEAEDGTLWVGTTRGINVFDGGAFLVFGTEDGMASAEVNNGAAYRSRDGRLWFGTVQGLVVFEPTADLRRVPPPPIYLTRVEVEDVAVAVDRSVLELHHARNDLRFEFVGLSLAFPETVFYEYQLNGLDKRWRTTRSRFAEYPSLPPGEYTFEVRARGRGGVPSPAPATLDVVISTPYWQTWWFRIAVAGSLLAIAIGLHVFRLRVVEARNLELVEQIHKRRQAEAEVRRYAEELEHTTLHDALTGLPNRALFQDRLQMAIDRARRHPDQPESRFALLWIDLDDFKLVNDSHGHRFGDRLLAFCARRLEQVVGDAGSLARLSGDEFAVLLPDATGPSYASRIADDLQQALARPFEVEDVEVVLNASIGIVLMGEGYERAEEMLRDADTAMYRSKARGRGGSALFDPNMHHSAVATLELEQDLRRALDRQEFELHFQPMLRLHDDTLMGFEALLRWRHPDRGLIMPGEFLDRAEATGLAGPLGHWTLEEALRRAAEWPARPDGSPVAVSINLFHRQVTQPDLPQQIAALLHENGLPAEAVHLEITEDVLIEEAESAIAVLRRIQAMDVQVYLDDFGTGYSSLSYLQKFPVDALKVDRSFVGRMDQDEDSARIVESILYLARSLGLRVVAEGVETADHLERLRTLDCDFVQGYLISRPVPTEAAQEWAGRDLAPEPNDGTADFQGATRNTTEKATEKATEEATDDSVSSTPTA